MKTIEIRKVLFKCCKQQPQVGLRRNIAQVFLTPIPLTAFTDTGTVRQFNFKHTLSLSHRRV
jgi:hypothetical protein